MAAYDNARTGGPLPGTVELAGRGALRGGILVRL